MVFSSVTFLFFFLPAILIAYHITPRPLRNLVLVLASLLFYTWGAGWIVAVLVVSIALNGLRKVKTARGREAPIEAAASIGTITREAEPDLKVRLRAAIDSLSEKYRTVFLMHDVEGYTHEEIGAALGIPPGTSKTRLFQGRAKLREALADFRGEWIND